MDPYRNVAVIVISQPMLELNHRPPKRGKAAGIFSSQETIEPIANPSHDCLLLC